MNKYKLYKPPLTPSEQNEWTWKAINGNKLDELSDRTVPYLAYVDLVFLVNMNDEEAFESFVDCRKKLDEYYNPIIQQGPEYYIYADCVVRLINGNISIFPFYAD